MTIYLSIHPPVRLSIYLAVYLSSSLCMYVCMYVCMYLSIYSCCSHLQHRAFVFLQFLNLRESLGLLRRGISPKQGRYLIRTTQAQNKRRQTPMHWVGFEPTIPVSSGRRHFMPQTSRPLWPANSDFFVLQSSSGSLALTAEHKQRLVIKGVHNIRQILILCTKPGSAKCKRSFISSSIKQVLNAFTRPFVEFMDVSGCLPLFRYTETDVRQTLCGGSSILRLMFHYESSYKF
jgi:hypothetical protein